MSYITVTRYEEIQKKKLKWMCSVCNNEKQDQNALKNDFTTNNSTVTSDKNLLDEINIKLDMIIQHQSLFKNEIAKIKNSMSDLRQTVSNLITENVNIRNANELLKERVAMLEDAIGDVKQQQVNNNVLIYGIKKIDNENLPEIVQKIAKAVDINIEPTEISTTFRSTFASKSSSSTQAIHINFNSNATKMKLMSAIKDKLLDTSILNFNEKRPIYINEQLTTPNQL